jgi:hypothetical protein
MADDFGLKIGVEGEKEFKKALVVSIGVCNFTPKKRIMRRWKKLFEESVPKSVEIESDSSGYSPVDYR